MIKNSFVIRLRAPAILLVAMLTVGPARLVAQGPASGSSASQSVTRSLLDKAQALDARGRTDLAEQTWKQVLQTDPHNGEALGGLARAAAQDGNGALAKTYLDRLRETHPNDPNIAAVEKIDAGQARSERLKQAAILAGVGKYSEAMAIYRQVFGATPPPGDWALAYYGTEAATQDGRFHALAGLRALAAKFPDDSRYPIALGRLLTYNPKTREEGRSYLERFPKDDQAFQALHQSLLWDAANPAMASQIRAYLLAHRDPQLARALEATEARVKMTGPAASGQSAAADPTAPRPGSPEMAAYQALNAKHVDEAETRFKAILAKQPGNAGALAGMGYVRLQQTNFLGAISFLEQAKQKSPNDSAVTAALDTARFWFLMGEGQTALNSNDLTTAEKRYRAALELRADSAEALAGLGDTLLKAQQARAAIPAFERAVAIQPASVDGWRGLFMAEYDAGNAALALATGTRFPGAVQAQLRNDPLFLQTLASAYSSVGRGPEAQKVLETAVDLTSSPNTKAIQTETQILLAGLLSSSNQMEQAAALYRQVLAGDYGNVGAWQGLVEVLHTMGNDQEAVATVEGMPAATRATAMLDPGFELSVATVYLAQKKYDVAEEVLQKAAAHQISQGQKPSPAIAVQLANTYIEHGTPQAALPIYHQLVTDVPERADAWAGLLLALHLTDQDSEVISRLATTTAPVRAQLETNVSYLQTMAAVYGALGRPAEAEQFLSRVEQNYAANRISPPADVEIQDAWLFFNGMDDAGLYRKLMNLGTRTDLTETQRRTVQTIWTNWAARRANQVATAGNTPRALAILNAAARSFPDNPAVLKELAKGYVQAGQPQQAVLIYKSQDMTAASSADYESAVNASLAASDNKDAEKWLHSALAKYPSDSQILLLGAKFEQARGNSSGAMRYYRASLKAMPPPVAVPLTASPGVPTSLPGTSPEQDLSILLAPETVALTPPGVGGNQLPLPPYGLPNSRVVPPYMTNPPLPSGNRSKPADKATSSPASQAEADATVQYATAGALGQPQSAPAESVTPQVDQKQQVAQLTEQAATQTPPATSGDENYRPSVSYIAPPRSTTPTGVNSRSGSVAVPVQLGNSTPPPVQAQTEKTDVFPTARYVPNTNRKPATVSDPNMAAAQADRVRRQQSDTAAQIPRPSTPPADTFDVPDTSTQQYPQPRTPPSPSGQNSRSRAARIAPEPTPTPAVEAIAPPATPLVPISEPPQPEPVAPATSSSRTLPLVAPPLYPVTPAPTDAELAARTQHPLPDFIAQVPIPMTPRQQTENALASLEGSYSGWFGATGVGRYRNGVAGLDRLYAIESPVEVSYAIGRVVRLTAIARPVFLHSGVLGTSSPTTNYVPFIGTLPANTVNIPAQQFSNGIGGELQLTARNFGIAAGYTPYQFLVHNVTGHLSWRPLGGHLTLFADRDSVKDTQLSYAGLRDPGVSAVTGPIWGGVIATGGGVRLDFGSPNGGSTFYVAADGGGLTGRHVVDNTRFGGDAGASFRIRSWTGGSVNLGGALSGMHYEHDEAGLTYGQGGYFSPSYYFLASVPVSVKGADKTSFHYALTGALGFQSFQQDQALFYPLDPALQSSFVPPVGVVCTNPQIASYNCGQYPTTVTTSLHYAFHGEASYRFAEHWYGGGLLFANNTNNYANVSAAVFFRYVFRAQPPSEGRPTGLFPVQGFRLLQIP